MSDELMSRLLRTKFFDWKYEEEYRLFVELDIDLREEGLFFADFDDDLVLREVILGPRCSLPIDRVRSLVREYDPAVEVIKARIAFSTFRVVENRYASRK